MSYIPDARSDEYYNQKYLEEKDAEFVAGFDWNTINAIDNLKYNLDIYEDDMDIEGEDINLIKFFENHPKIKDAFFDCIADYIESERDELITSMIDAMGDKFEKRKKLVDEGKCVNCLSTYKFEIEAK